MKLRFSILLCIFPFMVFAQQYKLSGKIYDIANPTDLLIGVNVVYGKGLGVISDINGNYQVKLSPGKYSIQFSYVGYEKTTIDVTIIDKDIVLDIPLKTQIIDEVVVTADVARSRQTPIAFSNISPSVLQENLGNQDIPMLLNKTPGVYATQQGGGDGDASVTIRGFSARNVGVLLDGVPVNDMETGQVYWSNWFGLDGVTRSIQVQRGLGASKLALPSVGGTINIITKGLDSKKEGSVKQEVGSDGYLNTSFGYSSGILKNGWAVSAAGSYKTGDGWVDMTWTKGFFYYLKIDKKIGNHIISVSAYGAPQSHGQRAYQLPIASYDSAYAEKLGIKLALIPGETDSIVIKNRQKALQGSFNGIGQGLRYNQHWGYLARNENDPDAKSEPMSERINEYHKPQITLKDNWTISDKVYMSNIAYMSIGNGGGIRLKGTPTSDENGLADFQFIYDGNVNAEPEAFFDPTLRRSKNYLRELVNEHMWVGLLSTLNVQVNPNLKFAGGIDIRSYKGTHYEKVYDLLGGDYAVSDFYEQHYLDTTINWSDPSPFKEYMLKVGDKNYYYTDGLVRWGGLFFQTEYSKDKIASFINLTTALSSYNQIDHFYMLNTDIDQRETGWKNFPGYTIKGGLNYNFTDRINGFFNLGILNKAPRFNNVYDRDNSLFLSIKNELVRAIEIGGSYSTTSFTMNINTYYTNWKNKPVDFQQQVPIPGSDEKASININGMSAIHKGIEIDFIYKVTKGLEVQGLMSLGDWRWNSSDSARIYDNNNNLVETRFFDATGVHVGNSAQTQFGGEIRWEPIKGLYFKPSFTYFGKYFSEFDPLSLNGTPTTYEWYDVATGEHGNARDSWEVPSYVLVDFSAGYRFKIKKDAVQFRLNILNALNTTYIATAQNNDTFNSPFLTGFDARSASAFFGMGRRFVLSAQYQF